MVKYDKVYNDVFKDNIKSYNKLVLGNCQKIFEG